MSISTLQHIRELEEDRDHWKGMWTDTFYQLADARNQVEMYREAIKRHRDAYARAQNEISGYDFNHYSNTHEDLVLWQIVENEKE